MLLITVFSFVFHTLVLVLNSSSGLMPYFICTHNRFPFLVVLFPRSFIFCKKSTSRDIFIILIVSSYECQEFLFYKIDILYLTNKQRKCFQISRKNITSIEIFIISENAQSNYQWMAKIRGSYNMIAKLHDNLFISFNQCWYAVCINCYILLALNLLIFHFKNFFHYSLLCFTKVYIVVI